MVTIFMFLAITTQTVIKIASSHPTSFFKNWCKTVAPYCRPYQIMYSYSCNLYVWILCSKHEYFPTFPHLLCLQMLNICQNCHNNSTFDLYNSLKIWKNTGRLIWAPI